MDEAIRQIHNTAMDLSELARIKKNVLTENTYQDYLKAAYELELYALSKLKEVATANEQLWQATIIQSAGWLALKCGYTEQAKRLAETGLAIPTDGYVLSRLKELAGEAEKILQKREVVNKNASMSIYGFLSAADLEAGQININDRENNRRYILAVQQTQISEIARLFLGTNVAVEAKKDENGEMLLEDIRWAA